MIFSEETTLKICYKYATLGHFIAHNRADWTKLSILWKSKFSSFELNLPLGNSPLRKPPLSDMRWVERWFLQLNLSCCFFLSCWVFYLALFYMVTCFACWYWMCISSCLAIVAVIFSFASVPQIWALPTSA